METSRLKVLFVEDDAIDQMAIERFVQKNEFPFDYTILSSIEHARAFLQTEQVDVAVLDYVIGSHTAFELFETLRPIPIIIVTGIGDEAIAVKAMKSGAYDYLRKDREGHYLSILPATIENVLKRRQSEEELHRQAQKVKERTVELQKMNTKLEQALRLKDEFLANISHELRTPLHSILGLSEALQEQVYGPLNQKQCSTIHTIEEKGRQLLELIIDLLDLSRIMSNDVELEYAPVAVDAVVKSSIKTIASLAEDKQLEVTCASTSSLSHIQADKRRVQQMLSHLLHNAVKFTSEGGSIGLIVRDAPERHAIVFTVWDTGIGIAKEDRERLFTQPLFQIDGRLSRRYSGIGLGLSLTYHLVKMHGGNIFLESDVGKGSRFTVELPVKRQQNDEHDAQ